VAHRARAPAAVRSTGAPRTDANQVLFPVFHRAQQGAGTAPHHVAARPRLGSGGGSARAAHFVRGSDGPTARMVHQRSRRLCGGAAGRHPGHKHHLKCCLTGHSECP
jgi:hypothetical protein